MVNHLINVRVMPAFAHVSQCLFVLNESLLGFAQDFTSTQLPSNQSVMLPLNP